MIDCRYDRLYLAKVGNSIESSRDIYVDKYPAAQHLIDGIRFLYRSYIKKQRGVILNDPCSYERRIQTSLFISAVLPMLDKPVLILCQDDLKTRLWFETFREWTRLSLFNDYDVVTKKPISKNKILISLTDVAEIFSGRNWSIIVLDDVEISKKLRQLQLRASFRIWAITDSIKQHTDKLTTFLTWINAKEKYDDAKYKANENDPVDVYTKMVMLDAFMEAFVLRRDEVKSSSADTRDSKTIKSITEGDKDGTYTQRKALKRNAEEIDHADETKPIKITKTEEQNLPSTNNTENVNVNMNGDRKSEISNENNDNSLGDDEGDLFNLFEMKIQNIEDAIVKKLEEVVTKILQESSKDENITTDSTTPNEVFENNQFTTEESKEIEGDTNIEILNVKSEAIELEDATNIKKIVKVETKKEIENINDTTTMNERIDGIPKENVKEVTPGDNSDIYNAFQLNLRDLEDILTKRLNMHCKIENVSTDPPSPIENVFTDRPSPIENVSTDPPSPIENVSTDPPSPIDLKMGNLKLDRHTSYDDIQIDGLFGYFDLRIKRIEEVLFGKIDGCMTIENKFAIDASTANDVKIEGEQSNDHLTALSSDDDCDDGDLHFELTMKQIEEAHKENLKRLSKLNNLSK